MISEKNVRNWEYRGWVENFRKNGENIKFKIFKIVLEKMMIQEA